MSKELLIKQVLLDMDGVIVDFVKGICNLHNRPDPYNGPEHLGEFDMAKIWSMPDSLFWANTGYDFWRTLEWTKDGKEILAFLDEIIGKENICILTAPCATHGCYDGKKDWLREHMPGYKMLAGSAKEFTSNSSRLLIDDRDSNIVNYHDAGGPTFMVPRPWNSAHARQDNWLLSLERLFLGADMNSL